MSWDIFVQYIPDSVTSIADLPSDFKPPLIGRRADIVASIRKIVPTAYFKTLEWGTIDGTDFSIEISMGDLEEIDGFAFHIQGGDQAIFVIADILEHLGLRALDPSSECGIFKLDEDTMSGFHRWRIYRNQIIANPS